MQYRFFNEKVEFFLDSFFKETNLLFSKDSFFREIDNEKIKIYTFLGQFDFIKYSNSVCLLLPYDKKGKTDFFCIGVSSNRSKGWYFNDEFSNLAQKKS